MSKAASSSIYRSRLGSLIGKSATAARLRLGGWGDKMFDCYLGKLDLSSVFFFLHRRLGLFDMHLFQMITAHQHTSVRKNWILTTNISCWNQRVGYALLWKRTSSEFGATGFRLLNHMTRTTDRRRIPSIWLHHNFTSTVHWKECRS
jgi:hypothetical protein